MTIGTLSITTAAATIIAGGYTIPGLDQLTFMGTQRYLGVPAPVWIAAAVFIVGTVFLTRTRDGIRLMAVGGNAEAVRRSGIHSDRYKLLGFVISAGCAALGGLVTTAFVTEASPAASPGIIFTALTAVALAGVSLAGGRGSLPRVLVGALDPGHYLERPHHQGHRPVLGHGRHRCAPSRLPRPRQVAHGHRLQPPGQHRPGVGPHRDEVTTMTEAPALSLEGVDMHYGFVRALDSIDFHVQQGEVVGLLGDNGAGKSTLLKVMSGAHRPTGGTIRVHGEEKHFHAPSDATRAGIQMVYQDLALVDALDISTNLNIGREILRKGVFGMLGFVDHKAQRKRSEGELDRLGVRTAAMTRPVEMLSGGQRQVVALARSATRVTGDQNGVLLLDEPTAALGYEQTQQVQALIQRMADQGIAIVLVTHNFPLATAVCDRIAVLNRGKKVADIPTAETNYDEIVGWVTGARASMFA